MERPYLSKKINELENLFTNSLSANDINRIELISDELKHRKNTGRSKKLKLKVDEVLNQYDANHYEVKNTSSQTRNLQKKINNLNYKVPDKYLNKMCMLGVDRAALSLIYNSGKSNLPQAIQFRDRFKKYLNLSQKELKISFDSLHFISENLLPLPLKYFLEPFANNQIRNFAYKLDRNFTIQNSLVEINEPKYAKVLKGAKGNIDIIASSLILHSQLVPRFFNLQYEKDVLGYIFQYGATAEDIMRYLAPYINNNSMEIEHIVYNHTQAFLNLTSDFLHQTRSWKNSSFNQLFTLANRLPRTFKFDSDSEEITDCDYPKTIKMCSVFLLAGVSENSSIKQKTRILHDIGLTNISDLVLLSPVLLPIWRSILK